MRKHRVASALETAHDDGCMWYLPSGDCTCGNGRIVAETIYYADGSHERIDLTGWQETNGSERGGMTSINRHTSDEIRAILPPFDADEQCSRCGHAETKVTYEKDTSHYGCPLGKSLETSWGPEHLTVRCQRCGFIWERRCVNAEEPAGRKPTSAKGAE